MSDKDERRALGFRIGEDEVADIFRLYASGFPSVIAVPRMHVPEGAKVLYAWHDRFRACFWLVLSHPSFPVWADGDEFPRADEALGYETVQVAVENCEDGVPRVRWLKHLKEENDRLRGVFSDLRQDSTAIDAAYRQGVADGIAHEQEQEKKREERHRRIETNASRLRALQASGVRVSSDEIRRMGEWEDEPFTAGQEEP